MGIGDRIKEKRIELHLSQEELAKRMGYTSKSTINKIELGKNDVNQKKIVQFAEALHTTVPYLMGWDSEEPDYVVPGTDILIETYSKLTNKQREHLLRYMKLLLEEGDKDD
jgi:transcriptional regulator with XRE-family HTH domain